MDTLVIILAVIVFIILFPYILTGLIAIALFLGGLFLALAYPFERLYYRYKRWKRRRRYDQNARIAKEKRNASPR